MRTIKLVRNSYDQSVKRFSSSSRPTPSRSQRPIYFPNAWLTMLYTLEGLSPTLHLPLVIYFETITIYMHVTWTFPYGNPQSRTPPLPEPQCPLGSFGPCERYTAK